MTSNNTNRIALLAFFITLTVAWARPASAASSDMYRIDFPGGTVAEYIELIRKTVPDINILLVPDAGKVNLPPISLHTTDGNLGVFFSALEYITEGTGTNALDIGFDGDLYFVRLENPQHTDSPFGSQVATTVSTFSLASLMVAEHLTAEVVLQSIEAVLEVAGTQHFEPDLRFHEPTSLLIVRATHEQTLVIRRTVEQLQETAEQISIHRASRMFWHQGLWVPEADQPNWPEEIAKRDAIIEELRSEIQELRSLLNARQPE